MAMLETLFAVVAVWLAQATFYLWLRGAYSARGLSRVGAGASVERPAQRPSNS